MAGILDGFNRLVKVLHAGAAVASSSVQIMGHDTPVLPTSVLCPGNLGGVTSFKIQVSLDDVTYYDIESSTSGVQGVVNFPAVINGVLPVPDVVQGGCMSWAYMRLVVNTNPSADILFNIHFAGAADDSPVVPEAAVTGTSGAPAAMVGLTPTFTQPAMSAVSATVLAANAARRYALIQNDGSADVYIFLGTPAVAHTGIRLNAGGGSYEISSANGNLYAGIITGITAAGTPTLLVTEGT